MAFVDGLIDNDEEVASAKKHTQFKIRVLEITIPYMYLRPKWPKSISYLWPKWLKTSTLWGCTYLYSPYKGDAPDRVPHLNLSLTEFVTDSLTLLNKISFRKERRKKLSFHMIFSTMFLDYLARIFYWQYLIFWILLRGLEESWLFPEGAKKIWVNKNFSRGRSCYRFDRFVMGIKCALYVHIPPQ